MEHEIPIKLGERRINQGSLLVDCPPVICINVASDKNWSIGGKSLPSHNGKIYQALIDTGSEGTAISPELSKDINATPTTEATLHGFNKKQKVDGTQIQIIIPKLKIVFACQAVISDLNNAGHNFSIVLGRSFLEHCKLELDGPKSQYRLWWVS